NSDEGVTEPEKVSTSEAEPVVCKHPDMMEALAGYIADEMNRNIRHPSVLKMKELLSYDVVEETRKQMALPWYLQIGATNPQTIGASNMVAAMAIWTERVGQNRPWDHKPKIHSKFGGYSHKQGKYDYFYDIWSNIHYGYVGRAGGLSESVLSDGAGLEQIASDSIRKVLDWERRKGPHATEGVEGLKAFDDAPDRISISIGIRLFDEHPNGGITAKMVMEKVLAVKPEDWGDGISAHECN
ncbi:polymorphic toxin type 44 domain-containing protein, partial [Pseudomonas cichorii]|uniref:polymorphic toxin type 44 domain-containing protein n=1 Tax=Pseudomonas cichorii TaxID=36746 RepID=UPI001F37CB5C